MFHRKAKPATLQDRRASLGIQGPHRAAELTTTPSATQNHLLKYCPQVPPDRRTYFVTATARAEMWQSELGVVAPMST